MGDLQPGVGYNLITSPTGDSLEILFPPQADPIVQQFEVQMQGDNVRIAKGRVITQDVWEGTTKDETTAEFQLWGVWAYPTGSKISGSDTDSVWTDNGSSFTIANAANEGSDSWGVYIVRQPFNKTGAKHTPELVIMADSSDADSKTTPWGEGGNTDSIRLYTIGMLTTAMVDGAAVGSFVTFDSTPSQYNYNCQRVKVASILWISNNWVVTQWLIGTLTLPNVIQYYGISTGTDGVRPDTYWPNYETNCDDWNGTWTGYTKASLPTAGIVLPAGFPA